MKFAVLVSLVSMSWLMTLVSANAAPSRFLFMGIEYVRLEDWADANRFHGRWLKPKEDYKLTSSSGHSLVFSVDSRKCFIDGVVVWLSHPIALRQNSSCVAWKDITTAVQPLLSPARYPRGKKIRSICLDAGHGGKDPGNKEGSQFEKKYTLLLAKEISGLLAAAGLKVSLTRNRDTYVELDSRPEFANRRKADLFVSLHFNSADVNGVKGSEVYCMTPAYASSTNARGEGSETGTYPGNRFDSRNVVLAYEIQKSLVNNLGIEDRGVRRARFAVLRGAEMPSALVEAGFMTHPSESKRIYDPAWRRELARSIVAGILSYKRQMEL